MSRVAQSVSSVISCSESNVTICFRTYGGTGTESFLLSKHDPVSPLFKALILVPVLNSDSAILMSENRISYSLVVRFGTCPGVLSPRPLRGTRLTDPQMARLLRMAVTTVKPR